MKNTSRSIIGGLAALALASGCVSTEAPLRAKYTESTATNPSRAARTQAISYDTIKINGKDYIASPLQAGYTAEVNGKSIPRSDILPFCFTSATDEDSTINGRTYNPSTNNYFAVNLVYTNGGLQLNDSPNLAKTKMLVHSEKLTPKATSTGALTDRVVVPSTQYPQQSVSIGNHSFRYLVGASGSSCANQTFLFTPCEAPQQAVERGFLNAYETGYTFAVGKGNIVKEQVPAVPTNTVQAIQLPEVLNITAPTN